MRRPLHCTHFPYTTLFRSLLARIEDRLAADRDGEIRWSEDKIGQDRTGRVAELRRGIAGPGQRLGPILFGGHPLGRQDRKSTRLNSSHITISYAVFCLKKK